MVSIQMISSIFLKTMVDNKSRSILNSILLYTTTLLSGKPSLTVK